MKNRNLDHKDDWMTPPNFLNKLDDEFHFDFDPCPFKHDLTLWDGLKVDWSEKNYVNPGYSLDIKTKFVDKALFESKKGKLCVLLLPVSTSSKLFHYTIKLNATEIRFVEGRIPFIGQNQYGQYVNYHLIQEVDKSAIEYDGKYIPKFIRAMGQHDSMIVIF